ncbi:MAG: hypothetical protein ACJ798_15875 [Phenylobacterium sp.]
MTYLAPDREPTPNDPANFGFRLARTPEGWRWTAYDTLGRVSDEGVAPTKALAAAHVVRALSRC